jgi:hypothetical protein
MVRISTGTTPTNSKHPLSQPPPFSLGPEFDDFSLDQTPVFGIQKNGITSYSPLSPLGPSPPKKVSRKSSPKSPMEKTKIKSGEFLFNKRTTSQINLNDLVAELEYTQSPVNRKVVREARIICPPRDTSWPSCSKRKEAANSFHKWAIGSIGQLNRFLPNLIF